MSLEFDNPSLEPSARFLLAASLNACRSLGSAAGILPKIRLVDPLSRIPQHSFLLPGFGLQMLGEALRKDAAGNVKRSAGWATRWMAREAGAAITGFSTLYLLARDAAPRMVLLGVTLLVASLVCFVFSYVCAIHEVG